MQIENLEREDQDFANREGKCQQTRKSREKSQLMCEML